MTTSSQPKPSFLEAGLPVAALSAECQRDNNARQRPPQNRLHIWWARRPPTISRAAVLAGLLPYDLELPDDVLPLLVPEPSPADLDALSSRNQGIRNFFEQLLRVPPTELTASHSAFLRALGVTGDAARAFRRLQLAESVEGRQITLGSTWGYRHERSFLITPSPELIRTLLDQMRQYLGLESDAPIRTLDFMAGGGAIPLEAIRYGLKTFANDLNPVASLVLKATLEYPAKFGGSLTANYLRYVREINANVRGRLERYFPFQPHAEWWPEEQARAMRKFRGRQVVSLEPGTGDHVKNTYLWLRTVPCPKCGLNIPLSTNFTIVRHKSRPAESLAAFPVVPPASAGNDCAFRIVGRDEWKDCRWPRMGAGEHFHPSDTVTYKGGSALCPRCNNVMDGDEVKAAARARTERGEGAGLAVQLYAVCAQVPVQVTYRNGEVKTRYLWRFRAPVQADLDAVRAAEAELARLRPGWEAQDLIPTEAIEEGDKTREPRNMGLMHWRDLFTTRQLLTNLTVLEEIRAAQARARAELPADQAEAVNVYLAFIESKVVNYNSVNTFWDYTRNKGAQTFSRHDFAFRAAFTEFEGARETVMWAASQILGAYEGLAGLIHGQPISLEGDDEELGDDEAEVETTDDEADEGDEGTGQAAPAATAELRAEVIVPTVTNDDAAALAEPAPGSVHLICVDPPYYNNVQYSELSNFFYVWLKRALRDEPGLAPLFREPLAESNREAVANSARWQGEADAELAAWKDRYDRAYERLRANKLTMREAKEKALDEAGPRPPTAKDRADQFYEDKTAGVFRRARQLLHPRGRMVVMFNHKETWAWRSLGMALIRAGFEIRSSVPVHTEAESSLNIRGLDAARSTVLLLCQPRAEAEQPVGNWAGVQGQVGRTAAGAAERFQAQGLTGTDLYLSALGPALWAVSRNWPVTNFSGKEIDLVEALDEAYKAVGLWRLNQVFHSLTERSDFAHLGNGFSAEAVDRDTQALWLWLDTFQGPTAQSDDVRKLAKSLNVEPSDFRTMGLVTVEKELFTLNAPTELDLRRLARQLGGEESQTRREARLDDQWEQRTFPNFVGAAVWNALALMSGDEAGRGARGPQALQRWLAASGYGLQREFRGAFAVTLVLLEAAFGQWLAAEAGAPPADLAPWVAAAREARRAWNLVIKDMAA